jgi:PAS domain S-box-containing protein
VPLSARCQRAPLDQLDKEIEQGLQEVNSFFGGDRMLLWEIADNGRQAILTHYHAEAGFEPPDHFHLHKTLPYIFDRVLGAQNVCVSHIDDLPQSARVDRQYMEQSGVRSFMVIPLLVGGDPRGVLTIACIRTERTWTNEDLFLFQRVGAVLAGALDRRHAHRMIDQRMRFETMIADLSASVLRAPDNEIDRIIEQGLARVAVFFGAERIAIMSVDTARKSVHVTHAYYAEGVAGVSPDVELAALFPWSYEEHITRRNSVNVTATQMAQFPPEADQDRRSWEAMGVRSNLTIPLITGDRVEHLICIQSMHEERVWPDEYISRLRLLGEIFINALHRKRSENMLRKNKARLKMVIDVAALGFYETFQGPKGMFLDERMQHLLGLPPGDDQRGLDFWLEHIYPGDLPEATEKRRRLLSGETHSMIMEYRYQHPQRGLIWIYQSTRVVDTDSQGRPVRLVGVLHDITERKQAEQALLESKALVSSIFESTNDIIFSVDAKEFRLLTFNNAMQEYFAKGRGLVIRPGMSAEDMVSPDFSARARELLNRALREGGFSTEFISSVGSKVFLMSFNLLKKGEEVFAISVIARDITDRKRSEEELQRSEERFRQVAENVSDFIWEVDSQGLYTYTSPSVDKILGYQADELIGKKHFYDLFVPDMREELKAAALYVFKNKQSFKAFPNANVRKDGRIVYLETSGIPIVDEAGNLLGYRGADTDITERKEAEAKLQSAYKEIRELKDRLQQENIYLRKEIAQTQGSNEIIGDSAALKYVLFRVEQVSPLDTTVLLLGETGSGKGVIARRIHASSGRRNKPFITVNCAALPANLIESELFGREKGAFTGSHERQMGRFELADGGTIFLDEIGEMALELQSKLLRVIQDGEFERLGSPRTIKVDVRIIASTNRNLEEAVRQKMFREDLYYRLNVFPVTIPPLRQRMEDIEPLVKHFMEKHRARTGFAEASFPPQFFDDLRRHSWPGNVRELESVVERAMITSKGADLNPIEFVITGSAASPLDCEQQAMPNASLAEMEREHIVRMLKSCGWRIEGDRGVARVLGVKPSTLRARMKKLGVKKPVIN